MPTTHKNDVVVMENAAFHKSQRTAELIKATGATLLFLPPYSPDIMPIEKTFGTIKRRRKLLPCHSIQQAINMYC